MLHARVATDSRRFDSDSSPLSGEAMLAGDASGWRPHSLPCWKPPASATAVSYLPARKSISEER